MTDKAEIALDSPNSLNPTISASRQRQTRRVRMRTPDCGLSIKFVVARQRCREEGMPRRLMVKHSSSPSRRLLAAAGHSCSNTARSVLDGGTVKPFSVSARDGLAAKQTNNIETLKASGVLGFEEELVRFLTAERSRLFLSAMFDRVSNVFESLPEAEGEHLAAELKKLRQQSDEESKGTASGAVVRQPQRARLDARGVTPCEMCRGVLHQLLDFFRQYQYDLAVRPEIQEEHARIGGFCPLHTWHYEQVASPRGVCTAYPRLLNHTAQELRAMAANGSVKLDASGLMKPSCPACTVRWDNGRQIGSLDRSETREKT